MKTNNKKKIVVSTLALAMGAALAGSVSGSVAWYQYSTRSVAEFQGAAAHCTENIQIRYRLSTVIGDDNKEYTFNSVSKDWDAGTDLIITGTYANLREAVAARDATPTPSIAAGQYCTIGGVLYQLQEKTFNRVPVTTSANRTALIDGYEWQSDLRATDIAAFLTNSGRRTATDLVPVTSKGNFDGTATGHQVAETLYREPVYQSATDWNVAAADDFINLPLELRVLDVDGEDEEHTLAKPIYVTDVTMEAARGSEDITNALRLGVSASVGTAALAGKATLSKQDLSAGINAYSELDLNNDGDEDSTNDYSFQAGETILYGAGITYLEVAENKIVKSGDDFFKVGAAGDSFTKTDLTGYADADARDADLTTPANGDLCFINGANAYQKYNGTSSKWEDQYDYLVATSGKIKQGDNIFDANDSFNKVDLSGATYLIKSAAIADFVSEEPQVGVIADDNGLLGTTTASENLNVDLKIYLEGWQELGATPSALWSPDVIGAQFNLGIRFATTLHENH